jgi:hypothetical protein
VAATYLYANALLYAIFALWCMIAPRSTAVSIGFTALSSGGRSEYLAVYGGLQAGLAAVFFILAQDPARHRLGLLLAVALYAPVVLVRCYTLVTIRPLPTVTLATAALEFVLLAWAVVAYAKAAPAWPSG